MNSCKFLNYCMHASDTVALMVNEIFNFENRTSDGENFRRSGEMTLQYISYSTPKVQRSVVFLSDLHLSGFSKGLM